LQGADLKIEVKHRIQLTRPEDGYGLLLCKQSGERHLEDFDVAKSDAVCWIAALDARMPA